MWRHETLGIASGLKTNALVITIVFVLTIVSSPAAQAQTYQVLYNFTYGHDGALPVVGLTIDQAGNLYGAAANGGNNGCSGGCGTVFQLKHKGSGWIFNLLYGFTGGSDGYYPESKVIFGPDGSLYGATSYGGQGCNGEGCGTVFNLKPPPRACTSALCPWTETVLYRFAGTPDGEHPFYADPAFDQAGNLYGTTSSGGNDWGIVYSLTRSGNTWMENILYSFQLSPDGQVPFDGVVPDAAGNLYGTTWGGGGFGAGTVFQLTPSGNGWTEKILYAFQRGSDGGLPQAGLIMDHSGNLFGATTDGGSGGGGTVFELMPQGGGWTFKLLYSFSGGSQCGPLRSLAMDASGNLYGTTKCDGSHGYGNVFELMPSGGGWTYKDLYDFSGGTDGANPYSNVVFDAAGNLYGTAEAGGSLGHGAVWEITP